MTASYRERAHKEPLRPVVLVGLAILAVSWQGTAQQASVDGDPVPIISFSTVAGDVDFAHEMHFTDLEIECTECHHEANARSLETPHSEYLESSSIDCSGCHREGLTATQAHSCSRCHPDTPADIADERLSSKVVIHEVCWRCHEEGTGESASRGCASCHQRGPESH